MRRLLVLLAACGSAPPPVEAPPAGKRALDVPLSEPAEYDIDRISRDAGERIFTVTGVGDPYRTGIPYPMFLALLRQFPQVFLGVTAHGGLLGYPCRRP